MLAMLSIRPERSADLVTPEVISVSPDVPLHYYTDSYGNTCTRLIAPAGRSTLSADFTLSDSREPDPDFSHAEQHPVEELPDDVIVYLLGSRYCDTQLLLEEAWRLFGGTRPGAERVGAILEYAHKRIGFDYKLARPTRTAFEAHEERVGVCRDYSHLAITLFRCMNIPARYCTGYMGDIDWPYTSAMDFSAWSEIYLGGRWWTVDARHNTPRKGRVVMAIGRDAVDTALTTAFGAASLVGFTVTTDEIG
jgi:transglutaminase-like putative cysteine protease